MKRVAFISLVAIGGLVLALYVFPSYSKMRPGSWAKSDANFVFGIHSIMLAGGRTDLKIGGVADFYGSIGPSDFKRIQSYLRQRKANLVFISDQAQAGGPAERVVLFFQSDQCVTVLLSSGRIEQIETAVNGGVAAIQLKDSMPSNSKLTTVRTESVPGAD